MNHFSKLTTGVARKAIAFRYLSRVSSKANIAIIVATRTKTGFKQHLFYHPGKEKKSHKLNFEDGQHNDAVTNPNQFCILGKVTPRKGVMVTSFLNEVSMDHLENMELVRGK